MFIFTGALLSADAADFTKELVETVQRFAPHADGFFNGWIVEIIQMDSEIQPLVFFKDTHGYYYSSPGEVYTRYLLHRRLRFDQECDLQAPTLTRSDVSQLICLGATLCRKVHEFHTLHINWLDDKQVIVEAISHTKILLLGTAVISEQELCDVFNDVLYLSLLDKACGKAIDECSLINIRFPNAQAVQIFKFSTKRDAHQSVHFETAAEELNSCKSTYSYFIGFGCCSGCSVTLGMIFCGPAADKTLILPIETFGRGKDLLKEIACWKQSMNGLIDPVASTLKVDTGFICSESIKIVSRSTYNAKPGLNEKIYKKACQKALQNVFDQVRKTKRMMTHSVTVQSVAASVFEILSKSQAVNRQEAYSCMSSAENFTISNIADRLLRSCIRERSQDDVDDANTVVLDHEMPLEFC